MGGRGCSSPACSRGRPHTCGAGQVSGQASHPSSSLQASGWVLKQSRGPPLSYLTTLCRIFLSSWSRHTAKGQPLEPIICTLSTLICDMLI